MFLYSVELLNDIEYVDKFNLRNLHLKHFMNSEFDRRCDGMLNLV